MTSEDITLSYIHFLESHYNHNYYLTNLNLKLNLKVCLRLTVQSFM